MTYIDFRTDDERRAWEMQFEDDTAEYEAYVYHVLLTPEQRRHMHETDFPIGHLFTEETNGSDRT